jgi:hypothetical protein
MEFARLVLITEDVGRLVGTFMTRSWARGRRSKAFIPD